MELRIVVRRARKIVLITLFLLLILLSVFLFVIQSILDGIGLQYTIESYASVGTVYRSDAENAAFTPVEEDVLALLAESDAVQKIDIRQTLSAKVHGMENNPCYFAVPQTNHLVFFRGTVLNQMDMPAGASVSYHARYATARVDSILAGQSNWIIKGKNVDVAIIWNGDSECSTTVGEEYCFLAHSSFSSALGMLDTLLYAPNYTEESVAGYEKIQSNYELYHDTVLPVPDFMSGEEADAYFLDILKSRGLDPYIQEIKELDDVFTIRLTSDMQMLIPVANEVMFFTAGRGIRPDDSGKKVCVISHELAALQQLNVGDYIPISLGDGCYTDNGYESGFPAFGELSTVSYNTPQDYEIIGIYAFSSFDPREATLLFGYNDIFIPASTETIPPSKNTYPYTLSFCVGGPEYNTFLDTTVADLADMGYTVQMSASRWEDVESTYEAMASRRRLTLLCAILSCIAGIILYVLILLFLYRKEFALRELFGASFRHTRKAYTIPFAVSSVIASVLAVFAAYLWYLYRLVPQTELIAPGRTPANAQILAVLTALALIQMLMTYILILCLSGHSRRKSVLRLLK